MNQKLHTHCTCTCTCIYILLEYDRLSSHCQPLIIYLLCSVSILLSLKYSIYQKKKKIIRNLVSCSAQPNQDNSVEKTVHIYPVHTSICMCVCMYVWRDYVGQKKSRNPRKNSSLYSSILSTLVLCRKKRVSPTAK